MSIVADKVAKADLEAIQLSEKDAALGVPILMELRTVKNALSRHGETAVQRIATEVLENEMGNHKFSQYIKRVAGKKYATRHQVVVSLLPLSFERLEKSEERGRQQSLRFTTGYPSELSEANKR